MSNHVKFRFRWTPLDRHWEPLRAPTTGEPKTMSVPGPETPELDSIDVDVRHKDRWSKLVCYNSPASYWDMSFKLNFSTKELPGRFAQWVTRIAPNFTIIDGGYEVNHSGHEAKSGLEIWQLLPNGTWGHCVYRYVEGLEVWPGEATTGKASITLRANIYQPPEEKHELARELLLAAPPLTKEALLAAFPEKDTL